MSEFCKNMVKWGEDVQIAINEMVTEIAAEEENMSIHQ